MLTGQAMLVNSAEWKRNIGAVLRRVAEAIKGLLTGLPPQ
jgi:hypothetical protein